MKKINKDFGKSLIEIMKGLVFLDIPIVEIVENVSDICRDIKADKLIQEKELAELEAKIDSYIEYTNFYKEALNKCYELERKELELADMISNKIVFLLEKLELLEENSIKIEIYIELINRYQGILDKIINNLGKYYNEKIIESSRIDIPEFIKYTEIGKQYHNRKKLVNIMEAEYV